MTNLVYEDGSWVPLTVEARLRFCDTISHYLKGRYGRTAPVEEIQHLLNTGPSVEPFNYPGDTCAGAITKERNRRAAIDFLQPDMTASEQALLESSLIIGSVQINKSPQLSIQNATPKELTFRRRRKSNVIFLAKRVGGIMDKG
jgi:hypothetical protein